MHVKWLVQFWHLGSDWSIGVTLMLWSLGKEDQRRQDGFWWSLFGL